MFVCVEGGGGGRMGGFGRTTQNTSESAPAIKLI